MPTPCKPARFARAAGYEPGDFRSAVQSGEDTYAGLPIGEWRQNGGEYLAVPDDYARQLGFDPSEGRSNPGRDSSTSEQLQKAQSLLAGTGEGQSAGVAAAEAAPPVSANASAAYAAGQFAETVKEQPQVMEDFADTTALLASLAFGYATADEGQVLKGGATAAGVFAAWKLLRHQTTQADRRIDMKERQQRHQIQQQRQKQLPARQQGQGKGRRKGNGTQTVTTV